MDLSLMETLRFKIATVKTLADAFEYFFDHFGENSDFFDVGTHAEDDLLISLLSHIGGTLFKTRKITLGNMRLIEIKEHDFIHGALTINGAMSSVIYCTDLRQGILSVYMPHDGPRTQFVRFSAEMLPPNFVAETTKFKH